MPNIGDFVRDWNFTPAFDSDSFPQGHTLLIGIADAEKTRCNVAWQDRQDQIWCVTGIPFVDGVLESHSIDVRSLQLPSNLCWVKLSIQSDGRLKGEINSPSRRHYGNGPVGTFTAEAGSGEKVVGATRLEESLAV